jgi:hypothetical protein
MFETALKCTTAQYPRLAAAMLDLHVCYGQLHLSEDRKGKWPPVAAACMQSDTSLAFRLMAITDYRTMAKHHILHFLVRLVMRSSIADQAMEILFYVTRRLITQDGSGIDFWRKNRDKQNALDLAQQLIKGEEQLITKPIDHKFQAVKWLERTERRLQNYKDTLLGLLNKFVGWKYKPKQPINTCLLQNPLPAPVLKLILLYVVKEKH